jgi:hypothetical protein
LKLLIIFFRLLKYKAEWKKQFRELKVRKQQRKAIENIDPTIEKAIIFFIPGVDYFTGIENITGGLMSIVSLAQESSKIVDNPPRVTICSTFYNEHLIYRLTTFENNVKILRPKLIERRFKEIKNLIVHIPELFVEDFVKYQCDNLWLRNINYVHINILNQNIQLMPPIEVINQLKQSFPKCTITAAHKKYCNEHFWKIFDMPLHLFSTYVSPELYRHRSFNQKEKLILFSPDNNNLNIQLIHYLSKYLSDYRYQVIQNLTYESYKELISKAMFIVTLGEGLDGYFVETYFSGGVAFARKNLDFFDDKYLELPCLFDDEEDLEKLLLDLIQKYENDDEYNQLNDRVSQLLAEDYSYKSYQNNLRKFYNKDYTYS